MFKCKVCAEKEIRIFELKEQIAYLKNQLHPPQRINKYEMQEDLILDGANREEIDPAAIEAAMIEESRIRREADLIFTGNDIEIEKEYEEEVG